MRRRAQAPDTAFSTTKTRRHLSRGHDPVRLYILTGVQRQVLAAYNRVLACHTQFRAVALFCHTSSPNRTATPTFSIPSTSPAIRPSAHQPQVTAFHTIPFRRAARISTPRHGTATEHDHGPRTHHQSSAALLLCCSVFVFDFLVYGEGAPTPLPYVFGLFAGPSARGAAASLISRRKAVDVGSCIALPAAAPLVGRDVGLGTDLVCWIAVAVVGVSGFLSADVASSCLPYLIEEEHL